MLIDRHKMILETIRVLRGRLWRLNRGMDKAVHRAKRGLIITVEEQLVVALERERELWAEIEDTMRYWHSLDKKSWACNKMKKQALAQMEVLHEHRTENDSGNDVAMDTSDDLQGLSRLVQRPSAVAE